MLFKKLVSFVIQKIYRAFGPHDVDVSSFFTAVPAASSEIPNTVYQTWKYARLPPFHARGFAHFRQLNPDYSFSFFDDREMTDYMRTRYAGHPILAVFDRIRIPAAKADIWRYCVLFREGGVYCDIDSALSIPLRDLLKDDPPEMMSFESNTWSGQLDIGNYADPAVFRASVPTSAGSRLEHPQNVILNWMLCFKKGHPILEEAIALIVRHFDFYRNKTFDNMWKAVIHCTGPIA